MKKTGIVRNGEERLPRTNPKISVTSFVVCVAIVAMAVLNQYLSGQY